jgi:hypothetical protein
MTKAVIFYTDGTSHKLALPGYNLAKMNSIVDNNITGYPKLIVDHINVWLER